MAATIFLIAFVFYFALEKPITLCLTRAWNNYNRTVETGNTNKGECSKNASNDTPPNMPKPCHCKNSETGFDMNKVIIIG